MGACGCGDLAISYGYELPNGWVLGYDIYAGCDNCNVGPGFQMFVFPDRESEWVRDATIVPFEPDRYGGGNGYHSGGIAVALFSMDDLKAEVSELSTEGSIGPGEEEYATVNHWIEDFGWRLVKGVMHRGILADLNKGRQE